MTAMSFMNSNSASCSTAAAVVSAHNVPILDTAISLVVSICVLGLLRIIGPNV